MASSLPPATPLYLPSTLSYPIQVSRLLVRPADKVSRGTALFHYSYEYILPPTRPHPASLKQNLKDGARETRFGTWESLVDGVVGQWNIKPGEQITLEEAARRHVLTIQEECTHPTQIFGLCAVCGKDTTIADYNGYSDSARASIRMTHDSTGPTVSLQEAYRLEMETSQRLLRARKLSLIVDLDQTIVHATVDPTVGEWIQEGEAFEAKKAKGEVDGEEHANPNWEALKDVKQFRLGNEVVRPRKGNGKDRDAGIAPHDPGSLYYVKPRPGLQSFLMSLKEKYEMHVYTMGTRAYATEVCAAIDPNGDIFGQRILSRDESGSMTMKSLQRLFPCDTSMVVIIDDRADVWEWSPNLVKVIPYDFFIGIGDINATGLPKQTNLVAPPYPPPPTPPLTPASTVSAASDTPPATPPDVLAIPLDPLAPAIQPESDLEAVAVEASKEALAEAIEAQVEERPLAKAQEVLEALAQEAADEAIAEAQDDVMATEEGGDKPASVAKPKPKALLNNNDAELTRVLTVLDEVHTRFYTAYDVSKKGDEATTRRNRGSPPAVYDVKVIIPQRKSEVFGGLHLLFSSVIPLETAPETSDFWRMARAFGATCHKELSSRVTHVVAGKMSTAKVDAAFKRGGIKVMWVSWFLDSVAQWRRMPEAGLYLMEPTPEGEQTPKSTLSVDRSVGDPDPDPGGASELTKNRAEEAKPSIAVNGVSVEEEEEEPVIPDAVAALSDSDVDWTATNQEVDDFLAELGDDDDDEEYGDEEDRLTDSDVSNNSASTSTSRKNRKRRRSATPSSNGSVAQSDDEAGSPLLKRKKLAESRRGNSSLKVDISSHVLIEMEEDEEEKKNDSGGGSGGPGGNEEEEEESEEDMDAEFDDFLMRDLANGDDTDGGDDDDDEWG
ncbi:hypothetical protein BOTBODRAFT_34921 [Botryobasidium botryosum FD-172 SS1]|uniref:RNA polymerase II subunit A C-terminal domain phosphatase n=1 Tax=Botryobasidium botryosum (strain FD-172 SS1) TaxID=930990 RepID=A0A067MKG2_BOTB1|nr:hypothetical protein BOTBODRAFT_34921 [Botryobasidium botryosum FD-172 SS1]